MFFLPISERLLKREEELVEFYKSESEHSDKETDDSVVRASETGENSADIVSKQLDPELIEFEEETVKTNERLTDVDDLVENADNSAEGVKNAKIDENPQDSSSDLEQKVDELASCNTASSDQKTETFTSTRLNQTPTESQPNEKEAASENPLSTDDCDQNMRPENNGSLPNSENFDLILQESIDDAILAKPSSGQSEEKQTPAAEVTKNDIRSKKLALLSRLNLPIRRNVGLNVSTDVVELDGDDDRPRSNVFDFMEKFVAHVSINKTKIQSSSKSR